METSDADQLAAWRAGDQRAGRALFERYYDPVCRFFRNKTEGDFEDLVHQTFEALARSRDRVRDEARVRAYIFGVAYNVLRKHWRARARGAGTVAIEELPLADAASGPSTVRARRAEHRRLLAALRRIPLQGQVALELFYWEDMSSAEIADVLGIPRPTVRSRLRLARSQLLAAMVALESGAARLHTTEDDVERWAREIREVVGA